MSLPSWKSYGGVNSMEKTNNITVNSLSANFFTLKNAYEGYFTILGELSVSENTSLRSNVTIGGNNTTNYDTITGRNNYVKVNSNIGGNLYLGNYLEVSGNTLLKGNLHILQNYEIEKNLKINGNIIQIGLRDRLNQLYNVNLFVQGNCLGYNKINPIYTLDVLCDQDQGFQIKSNTVFNTNTIAQNNIGQKIIVSTGLKESILSFIDSISSTIGSIKYSNNGTMMIDVLNNTIIKSKLTVNTNNTNKVLHSEYNESVLIHDTVNGPFLPDIYTINKITSGTALSLVSDNEISNTGMNIITPMGKGMKLLGGINSVDNNQSMAIMGLYDITNNLIPCQTMISGNTISKIRSTIGINTLYPKTENYVLDVNGPMKVSHNEIIVMKNITFLIKTILFYDIDKRYGISFGDSIEFIDLLTFKKTYKQKILYTSDKGQTWKESIFYEGSESITPITLICGFLYNSSTAIIGGDSGILLLSIDGFKTWRRITGITDITTTITSVIMINKANGEIIICFTYLKNLIRTIGFFIVKDINSFDTLSSTFIINTSSSLNNNGNVSIFYENRPPLAFLLNDMKNIYAMKEMKYTIIPIKKVILVVGDGGIGRLLVNEDFTRTTPITSTLVLFTDITIYNSMYLYYAIDTSPTLSVAVGKGIISTSIDGIVWTNIILNSTIYMNSIYIFNSYNAIAVGNNGKILVTTDIGITWNSIDSYINKSEIISNVRDILSVSMVDENTFFLCLKTPNLIATTLITTTMSIFVSCYFPDLFNHINNTIMDIYGNMKLFGDIIVYDNAYISKDMNVTKDCKVMGNSYINTNLFVQSNANIQGNTIITGNSIINQGVYSPFIDSINNGNNNQILIGTKYKGGTTIKLSDDTMTNPNNIFIGGIKDNVTIKGNNVSFLSNISLTYINDINNEILIGTKNGGGKTIRISGGSDGTGSSASNPNTIYIGGVDDNVIIKGNNVQLLGTISTSQSQIQLNSNSIGTDGSAGSGINIRDNNNNTSGYFRLNQKLDGYLFKSSDKYPNILNIRVDDLTLKNKVDINSQPIVNGLVIIKNSSSVYGEPWDGNITTMTMASFDVNNIILGNSLFKSISTNQQTISSDFGIQGNTLLYNQTNSYDLNSGSLQVRGGTSIIGNVYIGGNLISYKDNFFNGNVKMNSTFINDGDTILNGNVILKNPTSLTGNVNLTGSYNKFNGKNEFIGNVLITNNIESYNIGSGALIINGGIGVSGNLFIGKDMNIFGNTFLPTLNITNINEATNISGPLLIQGGACIKKSIFVTGNINVGNSLFLTNTTNVTSMDSVSGYGSFVSMGGGSIKKSFYIGDNENIGMNNISQVIPLDITLTSINQTITNSSTNYKNGLYSILASSTIPLQSINYVDTFNKIGSNVWITSYSTVPITTISPTMISIQGEYLQITLPFSIVLTSYQLQGAIDRQIPTSWYICGSNDGILFTILDYITNTTLIKTDVTNFSIINTKFISYNIYRIIIMTTTDNTNTFGLGRFFLTGYPSNSSSVSLLSIGNSIFLGNTTNCGTIENTNKLDSTSITTGSMVIKGGIGIQGNSYLNTTNIMGNLFVNKNVRIGTFSSSSLSSYALDVNGSMNVSGQFSLGNILLTDNTDATRLGTGSLNVNGGSSIKGNAYFGSNAFFSGNVTMANTIVTGSFSNNNINTNLLTIGATGSIQCNGDFSCRGKFINDNFAISATTESYNSTTGAFVVPGGIGIGGNLNVAKNISVINSNINGNQTITGMSIFNGNVTMNSICSVTNVNDATGLNTGSLQIKGGTSMNGNVITGGNMILYKQLFLSSKLDTTSLGTGSVIVSGGSSVSGNCHIGGNTIIYGAFGGSSTLGISFPSVKSPSRELFVPLSSNSSLINMVDVNINNNIKSATIISQNGLLSYRNGIYYFSTGKIQHNNYYGYNALIPSINNDPWISSYVYDNVTGNPIDLSLTTSYRDINNNTFIVVGDWLQYGLPYQLILSNYTIKFKNSSSSVILETSPSNWYLVGSLDNSTWSLIHNGTNNGTLDNVSIDLSETRPFYFFRFIIQKVIVTTNSRGVQVPGIFNITYSGLPYLSPIPSIVTTTPILSPSPSSPSINVNSNQEIVLPNSVNITSFVGPNTFAGTSTLVNFGDFTTYGNYNLFRNLNIFGNITTARDDYNITMNSNTIISGNLDINQNSFLRGQSTLYGATYLKEMVQMDKNLSIAGNLQVANLSTFVKDVSMNTNLSIAGNLQVSNMAIFVKNVLMNTNLSVSGTSNLLGDVSVQNITGEGNTTFNRSVICSSTSPIISNAILSNSSSSASVVTKGFVDTLIATEVSNRNIAIDTTVAKYLPLSGGTIVGHLTIAMNLYVGGPLNVGMGATINSGLNVDSGGVRIGSIGNANYNIVLNNSGTINAISYNATSDYRIKENIECLDDSFTIDLLRPVYYFNKKTGKKDVGLIAHELQEQYSFLVNGEKDGKEYQSVNYNGIIAILIKEIQILKQKVTKLIG